MQSTKLLSIAPSVPVWVDTEQLIFDRKFYDGMLQYIEAWEGSIRCVIRTSNKQLPAFGTITKSREELPFEIMLIEKDGKVEPQHLAGSQVVLASGDNFNGLHISRICKNLGIKCVYSIEYIPETRYQIIEMEGNGYIRTLRKKLYIWQGEHKRKSAFKYADGLQANGAAAYNEYKLFPNCHLYFDTRINKDILISDDQLKQRFKNLEDRKTLHLAFSGRLIKMKGADHLVELAKKLTTKGVDYKMTIYGAGDQESSMKAQIQNLALEKNVCLAGAVDFYSELIPDIKANVDLYVVLHRQSDPSCTYLETLSCGIPIVGYANKAFLGLLERADIGWAKPISDITGIADIVESLSINKDKLMAKSKNAIEFARLHDFETTFKARIKHLSDLLN